MLTTLVLAALLHAPATTADRPALELERPEWSFAPMTIEDAPEFPFTGAYLDFLDGERTVVAIRRMEGKRLMLHSPQRKAG